MKRILGVAVLLVLALTMVTSAFASTYWLPYRLTRARYPAGVHTADSSLFVLEGNAVATPACNDTTSAFYVGNIFTGAPPSGTSTSVPMLRVAASGCPTGAATDTLRAFVDLAMDKNGPWFTAGAAVPTGWDVTLLMNAPTAASDSVGAGATKAAYAAGSTVISPLSSQPVYSGCLALTGATIGTSVASPVGWQWARLRLTGDKTTSTINSLIDTSVWVSVPVDVMPPTPASAVGPPF